MSFLKFSPLTIKALMMVLLTSVFAFAIITTISVMHEHRRVMQEAHVEAERSTRQNVDALSASLWNFDAQGLQAILGGMVQSGSIVRAEVVADGKTIVKMERSNAPSRIDLTASVDLNTPGSRNKIGELHVSESYDAERERLSSDAVNLAIIQLIQTAGLAAIIFAIVYRTITRHLAALAQQVAGLHPTEISTNIALPRRSRFHDELDALVDALNRFQQERALEVRKRISAELTLRERVAATEATLGALTDGVIALDSDCKILYANRAARHMIGDPTEHLEGSHYRNHFGFVTEATDIEQPGFMEQTLQSDHATHVRGALKLRNRQGNEFISEINTVPTHDTGDVAQILVFRDISTEIGKERQIQYQAFHDPLTGLGNRSMLARNLPLQIEQARLNQHRLALLFVDLDNFKDINDTLGHSLGDILLKQLATRLRAVVQAPCWVTRHGGDEFLIVIPSLISEHQATDLAIDLMAHIRHPYSIEGYELHVTPSVGISIYPEHGSTQGELVSKADMGMYAAKKAGRNTYSVFNNKHLQDTSHRLAIENGLHIALAEHEFSLVYQPKVEIATGRIDSAEVLLRWNSKTLGNIPPSSFIPIAEDTGQIIEIGEWVLHQAAAAAIRWREQLGHDIKLSVNVSTVQFRSPKLIPTLRALVDAHRDLPSLMEIEVTEGALISGIEDVTTKLMAIKNMGFQIAIDDFGTGFSSLSYLKNLPIDTIKIDQAFIRDLHRNTQDVAIVSAVISLGQSLGFKIVAEGVTEAEHVNILANLKCDYAQGYYFSRPIPESAATELLRQAVVPRSWEDIPLPT